MGAKPRYKINISRYLKILLLEIIVLNLLFALSGIKPDLTNIAHWVLAFMVIGLSRLTISMMGYSHLDKVEGDDEESG